jgi:hypothetical protein
MLLNIDGLDKRWKKGVMSPFEGELGWHAVGDVEAYAPLIFRRVDNGNNVRELDTSSTARSNDSPYYNDDVHKEKTNDDSVAETNYRILRMTNKNFRDKLVVNFHRRWSLKDIVWPSRTGEMEP